MKETSNARKHIGPPISYSLMPKPVGNFHYVFIHFRLKSNLTQPPLHFIICRYEKLHQNQAMDHTTASLMAMAMTTNV